MAEPTARDYAYLLLLKMAGREITNSEMFTMFGVRLRDPDYQPLNNGGWVDSTTGRGVTYRHRLTEKGESLLKGEVTIAGAAKDPLTKVLPRLHELYRGGDFAMPGAPVAPARTPSLDERIRDAYTQLVDEPGDFVSLRRLRPLFPDVSRTTLNRALKKLLAADDVQLEPEPNQKKLDAEDREAAVRIDGEHRHLLAIGLR